MSSVDDRVVNMRFNNSAFERGARATLGTLDKLKKSLDFSNSSKSLDNLESSANRFHMGGMAATIEGVSKKFLALGTIGVTAISNIANRAVNAGVTMIKALTIDPIKAGLENYQTKINAIQTILANTKSAGTNLKDVTAVLNELNTYANQTVYNFSEMVKNIGTFTAAGVDLKTATNSIKGIANLAALSGSNSQQASTAMYQLSQAISAGVVHLQDWNSVVNAGMGGTVFQRALAQTAVAMGTLKKSQLELVGPMKNVSINGQAFRQSLTPPPGGTSWLTSKVLTTALSTFTGDLSDAQLAAEGFTKEQIKAIQAQAQTAVKAATQIKTVSQLNQALKEEVGTAWGHVWETILGDFHQAPKLLSPLHTFLENLMTKPVYDLNKFLQGWAKLGGRNKAIDIIRQAFDDLAAVIKVIHNAFRDIFPAETAKQFYDFTVRVDDFFKRIRIGTQEAEDLRRTFRGVFAIFDIIWQVIKGVAHVFGTLFSTVAGGTGSFLNFTGNIGDTLVAFDNMIKKGHVVENFFNNIAGWLATPIHLLGKLGGIIFALFSHSTIGHVANLGHAFDGTSNNIKSAWDRITQVFQQAKARLQPIIDGIKKFFDGLGNAIKQAMGSSSFHDILHLFNTVLLGGITLAIKKFLGQGINFNADLGGGVFGSIRESFEKLTGTLTAMQTQLKAKALLEIGAAVALLTASVIGISLIKPRKLQEGIKGLVLVFTSLLGAMSVLTKITASAGFIKLPVMAASLVVLSGAILILTGAVKVLAKLNWEQLKKGLTGIGVLLAELTIAGIALSRGGGSLARTGASLVAFAIAVRILANAVAAFSKLSWGEMLKGLVGIGGALTIIALAMKLMPEKGMLATGAGLLAVGVGLEAISGAVKTFASLKPDDLTLGLIGIGTSLATIAGAMHLMPKSMVAQAAGLVLVGIALKEIAGAVAKMGALNWGVIGKGLVVLAGSLTILAVAMKVMQTSVAGAVALGLVAVALKVLAEALTIMGSMSWSQIVKGLVTMAGALLILAATSAALSAFVPAIAALGVALLVFAAAIALAGAGVYLLGKGLGYLADHGSQGISTLLKALDGFIERIPKMLKALADGLVGFVEIIGKNAPKMIGAMGQIISSIAQAIIKALPDILELFIKLVDTFIKAVTTEAPKIVRAGLNLVIKLLEGIARKIPAIVKAAADIISAFLKALGDNLPRLIDAGLHMVVKVLNGIADGIDKYEGQIIEAGFKIGWAIIKGIPKGIAQALVDIVKDIWHMLQWLWDHFLGFFGISSPSKLAMQIGSAIIEGIWEGIKGLASWLWDQVSGFLSDIWNDITDFFGIGSPSKLMAGAGEKIVQGLGKGITDNADVGHKAMKNLAKSVKAAYEQHISGMSDISPKITPVLDLSNVRKDASKIPGIFGSHRLSTDVSLHNARTLVAVGHKAAGGSDKPVSLTKEIKFEQNNYSPTALSRADIYRQTNNQLKRAREVLTDDEA